MTTATVSVQLQPNAIKILEDVLRAAAEPTLGEPFDIFDTVNVRLKKKSIPPLDVASLCAYLDANPTPETPARRDLCLALARWDDFISDPLTECWTNSSDRRSALRRANVLNCLGVSAGFHSWFAKNFPIFITSGPGPEVPWDRWYTRPPERFYWNAYRRLLIDVKKWPATSVNSLNDASDMIVERLANPCAVRLGESSSQRKGLVIGHVQSGKTSNFMAVVAKAIDAGYRLIIVLAGTIDLLRNQTQERIDKELVGFENLARGIPEAALQEQFEYWREDGNYGSFNHLRVQNPSPQIFRFTSRREDYRDLFQNASGLFAGKENQVSLLVMKKNSMVLKRLVKNLRATARICANVPALIIDDESDQGTINVGRTSEDRTAVNAAVVSILKCLPRGQYVGYTATPFANVFQDINDPNGLFPDHFVLPLPAPPADYMGARDFSDAHSEEVLDPDESRDPSRSNTAAFVRLFNSDAEMQSALQDALDAYVLAGAIKLFRQEQRGDLVFKHHTMLVHEEIKTASQGLRKKDIERLWGASGYSNLTSTAERRLRCHYEGDTQRVSNGRRELDLPELPDFPSLLSYIREAANRIVGDGPSASPCLVVNSDQIQMSEQPEFDFDSGPVWKILVGGTKLSRGFTIEGLTVSFFRRGTKLADTLAQAGRWYGYRRGYRDLVRLYLDTSAGKRKLNLQQAFDAITIDEEHFREQLRSYALPEPPDKPIEPRDIPPLVQASCEWLSPTAKNKLRHAVQLVGSGLKSLGEREIRPYGYPATRKEKDTCLAAWQPILGRMQPAVSLQQDPTGKTSFKALTGMVAPSDLWTVFEGLSWADGYDKDWVRPRLAWFKEFVVDSNVLDHIVVVMPQLEGEGKPVQPKGTDRLFKTVMRTRRPDVGISNKSLLMGVDMKEHRYATRQIVADVPQTDPALARLCGSRFGALLLYLMRVENEDAKEAVVPGFMLRMPGVEANPGIKTGVRYFRAKLAVDSQ